MSKPTPRLTRGSRALKRASLLLTGLLCLLLATMASMAVAYLNLINTNEIELDSILDDEPKQNPRLKHPESKFNRELNIVLVGSDSREVLSEEDQQEVGNAEDIGGQRSDTLILVHIDPRRTKAVVVHFPRDLRVLIPDVGYDRVNTAYNAGGPKLVIRTVKSLTGLKIHHYVEVNFEGFQKLVETIDGVRICINKPMHDAKAGLDLDRAGCHTLRGRRALAFVRARNVEGDVIPDFARIARQQQFMRAMLNKLLSVRSLLQPSVLQQAAKTITTDAELGPTDLLFLGETLRELAAGDPNAKNSAIDFRVVPGAPQTIDGSSYVVADEAAMEELFARLRDGRPLKDLGKATALTAPSPPNIEVVIYDNGKPKKVEDARKRLLQAGFALLGTDEAPPELRISEILYAEEMEAQAEQVAGYFPLLEMRQGTEAEMGRADVVLVIGKGKLR